MSSKAQALSIKTHFRPKSKIIKYVFRQTFLQKSLGTLRKINKSEIEVIKKNELKRSMQITFMAIS